MARGQMASSKRPGVMTLRSWKNPGNVRIQQTRSHEPEVAFQQMEAANMLRSMQYLKMLAR